MKMNLPGVHGGVSQQSPSLRLQNQHESAANVVFDVVDGIKTRWPLRRVAAYSLTGYTYVGSIKTTDGILWMCYHRYTGSNWYVYMVPDDPDVTPVSLSGTTGYLAVASSKLKSYAVLDTLLVVNQDKKVALKEIAESLSNRGKFSLAALSTKRVYEASTISFTLSSSSALGVSLFSTTLNYTAAAGDTATSMYSKFQTDLNTVRTGLPQYAHLDYGYSYDYMYFYLRGAIVNYSGRAYKAIAFSVGATPSSNPTKWEDIGAAGATYCTWDSATFYYSFEDIRENGFTIEFSNKQEEFDVSFYESAAIAAYDTVDDSYYFVTVSKSFEDLPPAGFLPEVIFSLGDGYYVYYNTEKKIYEETSMVGHRYYIDKTTVPHELRYTVATNSWALSSVDAYETSGRLVGDSTSAPLPLFVGQKLNGVFFYRNRLCFLSLNNVSMSRVGNFYQFFPDTATEVLDSDPISIYPAYKDYSPLLYGIPHNKQLLLIGPEKQYVLHSGYDALSPTTVAIDEATSYKLLPQMEPLLLENSLVLFLDQGEYAGVLEYRLSDQEIATEGAILTDNVPRYIPNDITNAVYLQSEHMILCYKQDSDTVYVYKFHKNEQGQRMQSAWTQWVWPSTTWSALSSISASNESTLVICSQGYMYSMSTDEAVLEVPAIDIFGETTVTDGGYFDWLNYSVASSIMIDKATGKQIEFSPVFPYPITIDGSGTTTADVWIGMPIEWSVELSPLILRDDNGLPRADLKSTIKNLQVDWSGGNFRVRTFGTNLPTRITEVVPVTYQIHEIVPGESMRQVYPSRVLVMADSKRCRISIERSGFNHVKIHNIAYNLEIRKDKG